MHIKYILQCLCSDSKRYTIFSLLHHSFVLLNFNLKIIIHEQTFWTHFCFDVDELKRLFVVFNVHNRKKKASIV